MHCFHCGSVPLSTASSGSGPTGFGSAGFGSAGSGALAGCGCGCGLGGAEVGAERASARRGKGAGPLGSAGLRGLVLRSLPAGRPLLQATLPLWFADALITERSP